MSKRGFMLDRFLGNKLVNFYAKCGSAMDARRVFDQITERNVVSWTALIAAYVRQGYADAALALFYQMQQTCIQPDQFTFASVLPACANLAALKQLHKEIIRSGLQFDVFLGSVLVDMYAKCGSIENARYLFDRMPQRNVVSWTAMIAGYVQNGHGEDALKLFQQMQLSGVKANSKTFASVLPACANLVALEQGMKIHKEIIKSGYDSDVYVGSALVDMYAKCGNIDYARELFDKMPQRNVVSWNTMIAGYVQNGQVDKALNLFQKMPERNIVTWTSMIMGYAQIGHMNEALNLFKKVSKPDVASWTAMISGYAQNGHGDEALNLFREMQLTGVKPNSKTFASVLSACAILTAMEQGKEIHEEIIRSGFESDVFVHNALIDMYVKCGRIENGHHLFDKMHQRNVVTWTAMIAGYAQNGYHEQALKLFRQMQLAGLKPNSNTFASVLAACANLAALEQGMGIHAEIIRSGFELDAFMENALVDMYAKCGTIEYAVDIFDKMPQLNVVSWNTMIAGYVQNGHVNEAQKLFQKMPERSMVSWTTMISGYAQNGHIDKALKLFQEMPEQNVVSWTAMIVGYTQNGHSEEALKLFRQMQLAGVKPNPKTFASVLPACGRLAALEQGKEIHQEIIKFGFQYNLFVGSALIDMYAKCGSIERARDVFDKMHHRDVVSWTVMIEGYAMHGCGKEALELFEQMQHSGTNPNHVTLVAILSACCHAGLVDEGRQYFNHMSQYYCITPAMEHYGCMVDLLGRAGHLGEAQDLINQMPIKPDATLWGCLLGACRIHNNVELGESVAERLVELDPKNAAPYVLLSNIYAASGRWDGIVKVRKIMKDKKISKKPGCSWIEVNKQVHAFMVGDRSDT
eukprot:Gb_04402 [translate_table: standard]